MKSKISSMHTLLLAKIMLSIVEQFKRHHPRIFLNNNVDHLYIYFSFVILTKIINEIIHRISNYHFKDSTLSHKQN